ncbi:MAG: hypothetical protein JW783_09505 [Bacteroidales bacterium]|nr:hypothetical protein [Bacteroidales bacterium]MBN2748063.1 hypothetical protein [Bacteroidales bacterium]
MKRLLPLILFGFVAVGLTMCKPAVTPSASISDEAAFDSLITYIERSGDIINGPSTPALMSAQELYTHLDSGYLVVDIRNEEAFAAAHIENAVNVPLEGLLHFFENRVDANGFKKIAITCYSGQTASYATSLIRLLGYSNVYALKWGMGGWTEDGSVWAKRISSRYEPLVEQTDNMQNPAGKFPGLLVKNRTGYSILRERVQQVLADGYDVANIKPDTLFAPNHGFYVVNYWPKPDYMVGHIPGAVRYQPKSSLKRSTQLSTLPADSPIAVYCYTGQHSAFVTAYLRVLGYDAKSLSFGANGFMNGLMLKAHIHSAFTPAEIVNFPVVAGSNGSVAKALEPQVNVVEKPRGGC